MGYLVLRDFVYEFIVKKVNNIELFWVNKRKSFRMVLKYLIKYFRFDEVF